jgi:RHS repeat-associated protein
VPDYVRRDGVTYRIVSDHLGSPRYVVNVTDANDAPFAASYSAFGGATGTGLAWMPFGFAGGIYDADTGLVRFGARDYDPSVGRWTSKDPLLFASDSAGLYRYALSDPVNRTDPTGECGLPCLLIAAGAALLGLPSCLKKPEKCKELEEAERTEKEICSGIPLENDSGALLGPGESTKTQGEQQRTSECRNAKLETAKARGVCAAKGLSF